MLLKIAALGRGFRPPADSTIDPELAVCKAQAASSFPPAPLFLTTRLDDSYESSTRKRMPGRKQRSF